MVFYLVLGRGPDNLHNNNIYKYIKCSTTTPIIANELGCMGARAHFGYRTTPILRMAENINQVAPCPPPIT